jgi:hypothetical protein
MKTCILVGTMLGVALVLLPGTAHAKGVHDATVTGPGLERPIRFGTQPAANELAEKAGVSSKGCPARPPGRLFAAGGAITYTPPGQRLFDSEEPAPGGWFVADTALTDLLVAAGVPVPAGAVVSAPRLAG